jgi:hypothetical protein
MHPLKDNAYMAAPIIPNWYIVTVSHTNRQALMDTLRAPANSEVWPEIGPSGYTDGGTAWSVAVRSPATSQRQRDVLWQSGLGARAWCTVYPLLQRELDELL